MVEFHCIGKTLCAVWGCVAVSGLFQTLSKCNAASLAEKREALRGRGCNLTTVAKGSNMWTHVNAPPGNGKSAYMMTEIERSYGYSDSIIMVWSMTLQAFIVEYLQERFPERADSVSQRIRILTFEEGLTWWRCRRNAAGEDWIMKPSVSRVQNEGLEQGKREVDQLVWPELTKADPMIDLYLDEWADAYSVDCSGIFSPEHKSAIRQHRKFRINCWCATAFFNDLAKPYREVGQVFVRVTNTSYETMGFGKAEVQLPTAFKYAKYRRPPTSDRDKPFHTGAFRLDKDGLHKCYNTASGTGVNNRVADQDRKRRGLHWAWIPVAAVAVIVVVVGFLKVAPALGTKALMSLGTGFQAPGMKVAAVGPVQTNHVVTLPVVPSPVRLPVPVRPVLRIKWFSRVRGHLLFGFSDGSMMYDPVDCAFDGRFLQFKDGRVYRMEEKP